MVTVPHSWEEKPDECTAAYCDYFGWKRTWAKAKGMPRNYGHVQGSKNVEKICEEAWKMGIKYHDCICVSTENWNRPADEVNALMKLLRSYMKTCLKTADEKMI